MDGNERMDRLETIVATIAEATAAMIHRVDNHEQQLATLRELSLKNEEHIGIVVQMFDDWIRTRGKDKE
jgi:hypothetical protein